METIKRNIPEKLFLLLICIAAVLIPFHVSLTSPPLILSAFLVLLPFGYRNKWIRLRSNKRYLPFASLYLLFLFAYFISDNRSIALHDLKIKLYILVIPVIWVAAKEFTKREVKFILWAFVISCIAFALFASGKAVYDHFIFGTNNFYYKELVSFTVIHPAYIGMFQAFASIIIVLDMINNWNSYRTTKKILYLSAVLILVLFIFLLTAKMAMASMFIFLNIAFFIWGKKYISARKAIMFLIIGNLAAGAIILSMPFTRERLRLLIAFNEVTYDNSVNSRQEIWRAGIEAVQQNFLFGTGSGDAEAAMVEIYKKNRFQKGVDEKYNTHNQYLQVMLETGVVGLLFFTGFLYYCIRLAIRDKNTLYLCFLLLFMVNIFSESMLKSQSGVVFFAFFNSLLGLSFRPHD